MGLFSLGEKPKNALKSEEGLCVQILAYLSRKDITWDFELIVSPNLLTKWESRAKT